MANSMTHNGLGDDKLNNHMKSVLDQYKKTMDSDGKTMMKDQPHNAPPSGKSPDGPMGGNLMTWTKMLEAMDEISASMQTQSTDIMDTKVDEPSIEPDDKELLDKLNKLFTPVLVSQSFEKDISDQKSLAMEEAGVITEKNTITFDEESRMAQLIAVCALLIAQKKNTEKWQMYKKAAAIKTQAKLDIQKEEYNDAKALAQKYLVKVSTSNASSVARDAANDLLPQTQH